jgi:SDR family mycofactocin-dependent oxidoreductase
MTYPGELEGQVALITGAGRGQGRSHAVALAKAGANIVIQDICQDIPSVPYPLSNSDDLGETARQVEAEGREVISLPGDVRDLAGLRALVEKTKEKFGRLDIVIANAGIMCPIALEDNEQAYYDSIDVMLTGAWHTIRATTPLMIEGGHGGSLVLISSAAGLKAMPFGSESGLVGYGAAKHGVVGLMRYYANILAADRIRVNSMHPCAVATPMIINQAFNDYVQAEPEIAGALQNLLPDVPMIEPQDVTNAIMYLVCESGRYVTGTTHSVDAGYNARG